MWGRTSPPFMKPELYCCIRKSRNKTKGCALGVFVIQYLLITEQNTLYQVIVDTYYFVSYILQLSQMIVHLVQKYVGECKIYIIIGIYSYLTTVFCW
jgi:hypothetical protein